MVPARLSIHPRDCLDGDVLLYRRGRAWHQRLIAACGRSVYSHAAMAAWWGGTPMVLEMLAWSGGAARPLFRDTLAHPGQIDVYRVPDAGYGRHGATAQMRGYVGTRYGWCAILRTFARHTPILRLLVLPPDDDQTNGTLPYCSAAVVQAVRIGGGVDLVPNLSDWATEPGDLARSAALTYVGTLWP